MIALRVLHVHTDIVGGGIERMMTTLAAKTESDEVGICWCPANHPEPPAGEIEALEDSGIRLHRVPPPFLSPLYPARLARAISRVRPDVLHLHGASVGAIGSVIGRIARVPAVVYTEHLEHSSHAGWLRRARQLTARLPHWTVFVSRNSHRQGVENGPLVRVADRSSVIRNGVDLSPYAQLADDSERARTRSKLGIAVDATVIGCVGLLWQAKGQEHLIRALARIEKARRPLALLVGSGGDEEKLRACAEEVGVAASVRLLGWRDDVPRVLRALDVYVQPSLTEGLPLAVVEAAAARLPIVASNVGGIPEIIEHEQNGLLVPPGDSGALAAAIEELIGDPERARTFAENARRTAFEHFSAEAMASAYMELYEQLLSRAGR